MKVAIFSDTFLPQINGVTETLIKFMDYMDNHNIDYRIFAPYYDKLSNVNDSDKIVRLRSVKCVFYPQCRISIPRYSSIALHLDEFKPDIIHAITSFGVGIQGFKYARDYGIPLVSSYETNIPQYLDYYHLRFLTNFSWDFYLWFHSKCDKNYCPSKATLEMLKEKGVENLDIWERGVDVDRFTPNSRDQEFRDSIGIGDKITFLYVGRVSPEKDLDVFVSVAERLNIKYKDKIHFIIVGDGPSLKDLKKKAPDNITFTGFLRGEKLYKAYSSSDVFLFTSPTETLGFVLLEAMSSGLPAVACNEGGIRDTLINGYNGISCNEKAEDEFYNACEKLITDDTLRITLAENARNYMLEKSWEKTFDRLISSYQEVIDNKVEDNSIAMTN